MPPKSQSSVTPKKSQKPAASSKVPETKNAKNQNQSKSKSSQKTDPSVKARGKKVEEKKIQSPQKSEKSKKPEAVQRKKNQSSESKTSGNQTKNKQQKIQKPLEKPKSSKPFELSDIIEEMKPKKALTAFFFFSISRRPELQEFLKSQNKKVTEISKILGQMWQELSEQDKKPFVEQAEKDHVRYLKELAQYEKNGFFINQQGTKSTDLMLENLKFKKDVVQPKKVQTAFIFYLKTNFEQVKKQNPTFKAPDMTRFLSTKWNELSDKEKVKYNEMSKKDKSRFDNQIQELVQNGYFVDENGVKSCDMKKKVPRKHADDSKMSQSTKTGSSLGIENGLSQNSSLKNQKVGQKRVRNQSQSAEKKQVKKQKQN